MTFKLIQQFIYLCCICGSLKALDWASDTAGYKGRYGHEPAHYEVVVPHKITENGDFISYMIPHHYKRSYYRSKRSADDLTPYDKVHYMVPIAGEDHHLELSPSIGMVSPSMVVESYRQNGTLKSKIQPTSDVQCHYRGGIKGDNDSKAAISTCYGLTGYIRSNNAYYFIEPAADHFPLSGEEHPHLIYERQAEMPDKGLGCYVSSNVAKVIAKRASATNAKKSNDTRQQLHIESLVVLDNTMIHYHKSIDLENYVLTVFNMAHDLYHDCTLGINVNLAIVRLIRLEFEENEMNLQANNDANKTLMYFASWQKKVNPGDDTHPNHHDVAILITSQEKLLSLPFYPIPNTSGAFQKKETYVNQSAPPPFIAISCVRSALNCLLHMADICGSDKNCAILGAARVGSMCDPFDSAALCEDNGLRLGFVIAHEVAHTLAIPHDTPKESGCCDNVGKKFTTVMSPRVGLRTTAWSGCSRRFLQLFVDSGLGHCLYDPPTEHSFEMADVLPGVMYGGDFQCRELFGPNAALCETGVDCENLICYLEDKGCAETHMIVADGTSCGEKKWCYRGQCIQTGERPSAINGGWSAWTAASECSRTCGSGVLWQERYCNNPRPSQGGKYCQGDHRRYQICNTTPCDMSQPSFRDVQCSEFDDWVYPEDGKLHTWTSYRMPEENPCVLFCVNDEGAIASLKPRVADGTTCYRGMRDICINGLCQEIPCDLKLDSNAVEDACGVCHGDGLSCDLHEGKRFFNESKSDKVLLFEACKGSVNIKVEEIEPSDAKIQVSCGNGTTTYVEGSTVGMFDVPGSKAWLGLIRTKQEALEIPGPITENLEIWIVPLENVTVKYSYGTAVTDKRKGSYSWEFTEWSKCSAFCGPGTENAIPKCIEKLAGTVDDAYCKDVRRPKPQVRPCEIAPCVPRWMVGDWQPCSKCPKGKRERLVKCVRPTGEGEGEVDVIPDYECAKPKPKSKDKCTCEKPTTTTSIVPHKVVKRLLSGTGPMSCHLNAKEAAITRNRTVIDRDNITKIKLTLHVEIEDGRKYPKGVPRPKGNASVVILEGKEAIAFLNQMQKDFSNNRTKI